jgi:hypothetical protein
MKWLARSLAVVILGLGVFFAYRAFTKHRELQETLTWMDQTYNPHEGGESHGWEIHYTWNGNTEEVSQKYNQTFTHHGCRMVTRIETMAEGVYVDLPSVTTYTFNLRDIDPNSITVKTYDLHRTYDCSDPEEVKLRELNCDSAEVFFATTNDAGAINKENVTTFTKLTGADHESRNAYKTGKSWFIVNDVPYAQRFAKAFKHTVELCGGKASKF